MTVLKRGLQDWHGHEAWFAIPAYLTIVVLPFLVSGLIGDIVGDINERLIAVLATVWLFVYVVFVVPFFMWRDERYQLNIIKEGDGSMTGTGIAVNRAENDRTG